MGLTSAWCGVGGNSIKDGSYADQAGGDSIKDGSYADQAGGDSIKGDDVAGYIAFRLVVAVGLCCQSFLAYLFYVSFIEIIRQC